MAEPTSLLIGGLVKLILKVRKTLRQFETQLVELEWVLKILGPRIEWMKQFNEESAEWSRGDENLGQVRQEEMDALQKNLKQCKQLIEKCEKVKKWNIRRVSRYQKKLKGHSEHLREFAITVMVGDTWMFAQTTTFRPMLFGSAIPKLPDLTVGWKAPVEELKKKMFREDISVLGICGLGGCGKTTLATKFCEQVKGEFSKISFLQILTPDLMEMASRLWADLLGNVRQLKFLNIDDAMNHLNSRLEEKKWIDKVLVVIDDACLHPEAEKLVIRRSGFKTLVTTREKPSWIQYSYEVPQLGMDDAKDLFFHHAQVLDHDERRKWNRQLVEQIVEGCVRLPLALEVIGASLQNAEEWDLQNTATTIAVRGQVLRGYERVLKCLETSVEALSEEQRECFMDFCCFPRNKRIRAAAVMEMWVQIRGKKELGARKILKDLSNRHLIELFERRRNHGGDPDEGFGDLFASQHDLLTELAVRTSQKPTRLDLS